ncbi:MBOAT family protein [Flammeovirga sp. SJP92]|uniref:MBOAT family O-acyltransferase n=1 Tax=Flammeovirga sp. SJP92 TaxID=1775430 RepID=UPI000789A424|nr:MBOAT family O-acyltransferase [Flammeovirga sp. SJP92]KXX66913.1 acyltransferase [Flammeovirga sp. SJP92]
MPFNSIEFAIFLPIIFFLYWFVTPRSLSLQNGLLLVGSYVFYGWWDYRFLALIIISSGVDYGVGIGLSKTENKTQRKLLLYCSLLMNLSLLGFFKYYNFFVESFTHAFTLFGNTMDIHRLQIILPVGISFYTFQTLSYTLDVYKRKITPTHDIISFFAFVSFFPQLVAGPIERAKHLLPQFSQKRTFEYHNGVDGLRQILWGLFKKVILADNCALLVDQVFENYTEMGGSTLVIGAVFFAFQIYGDFSGYSDIAIGTARLFGFNLMQNFNSPYFSRNLAEFWRRWHISLNTWFRDYIYIPLGGSKTGNFRTIFNVLTVFLISGLWHGANWTFLVWGLLNALLFLPLIFTQKNKQYLKSIAPHQLFPSWKEALQMGITFGLVVLGWIFFRSPSVKDALRYINGIFDGSIFEFPYLLITVLGKVKPLLILIFWLIEWLGRDQSYALKNIEKVTNRNIRWLIYLIIIGILFLYKGIAQEFIYFQF